MINVANVEVLPVPTPISNGAIALCENWPLATHDCGILQMWNCDIMKL